MSDVQTAVQICSSLHQRYAEFSTQLLEHWHKVLPAKKDEKVTVLYYVAETLVSHSLIKKTAYL